MADEGHPRELLPFHSSLVLSIRTGPNGPAAVAGRMCKTHMWSAAAECRAYGSCLCAAQHRDISSGPKDIRVPSVLEVNSSYAVGNHFVL